MYVFLSEEYCCRLVNFLDILRYTVQTIIKSLYSKTCANGHSKIDKAKILMTNGSLIKVESIAECSILQYF